MPKFSVVIPIYKVEAYLSYCIESVLNQTYPDFELILVDDGSPDGCPKICDAYAQKDSRVRVIHKENGGLVSARIAGVTESAGSYICCLDGDDWLREDCLEKVKDAILETQADIVCFRIRVVTGENDVMSPMKPLSYRMGYYDRQAIETEIFPFLIGDENSKSFPPSICGKVFKRDLYLQEQTAVPLRIKIGEDGACTVPCIYHAESIYLLEEDLYFYRQTTTSMTKKKQAFDWEGPHLRYVHRNNRIDLDSFDFREQQYRSTVHSLFNVVVSQFYKKESYWKIVKDIKVNLKNPVYAEAIRNCRFSSGKGRLAEFALRYRLYGLMWLYSRIK